MEKKVRNKLLDFNIFNYISNGVFIIDSSRQIVFWNRVMEIWTGMKREEIFQKKLNDLFPAFNKFIYRYQINTVLENGTTAIFSSQLHRELYHNQNGEILDKYLHTTVNLLPTIDEAGSFAIFTIEDQSQLTDLIIKSNKILQQLHQKEEQLLKINQNLEMLVAKRTSDLQRTNDELKVEIEGRIKYAKELKESRKELQKQNIEYLALNSELKKTNAKLNELNDELEKARIKAEESDRLKSAFLANMSHEIRTPMNSIIGFSELLQEEELPVNLKTKYYGMILNSGNQLLALVNDILDISKIEAQQLKIFKNDVNIHDLINELEFTFKPTATEKSIQFIIRHDLPKDFTVTLDYIRIKQVLSNLISNAIKFTDDGFIELLAKTQENFLYFHIKDTGVGIKKEYHEKIFERFHQETQNLIKLYGGTGLGLTISKNLVELMDGKLNLQSEPGIGSTFTVLLPIKLN